MIADKNTFTRQQLDFYYSCIRFNTVADLEKSLEDRPDLIDMEIYGLTEKEWFDSLSQAIEDLNKEGARKLIRDIDLEQS